MNMYLFNVTYKAWNNSFSDLISRSILSVGHNKKEAIDNAKNNVKKDCRDFEASKIESVMGYKIEVNKIKSEQA